ncbi:hypothetical protein [Nocardia sp. NPDC056000]|uniref:hypothetical protein n=1 Tax=Nocardia sp. NPDC056000 TaxID=3345674 RepID=UPI0035DBB07D
MAAVVLLTTIGLVAGCSNRESAPGTNTADLTTRQLANGRIVYEADPGTTYTAIFTADADGGDVRQLTNTTGDNGIVAASLDGTKIA